MKIIFKPNLELFIAFSIINCAGYGYENNPCGQHFYRRRMTQEFFELAKTSKNLSKLLTIIKSLSCASDDYIRVINLLFKQLDQDLFFKNRKIIRVKKLLIKTVAELKESYKVKKFFKEYCDTIKRYKDLNKDGRKQIQDVLNLFNLNSSDVKLTIQVRINLLDSYQRGTNYNDEKNKIISFSLNIKNKINWLTARHELMHVILKHKFPQRINLNKLLLPVGRGYVRDSPRVKFEENFIYAVNLFFIKNRKKRNSNLKYYYDIGYTRIYEFYNLVDRYFVKSDKKSFLTIMKCLVKDLGDTQ